MAFRMPKGVKQIFKDAGVSKDDYNIIRSNLRKLSNGWNAERNGNFSSFVRRYANDFKDYRTKAQGIDEVQGFQGIESQFGITKGTSFEDDFRMDTPPDWLKAKEAADAFNDGPKLLPPGKGDINNNPVADIVRQQNTKNGGVVNSTVPASGPQGISNTKIAAENGTGGTINAGGTAKGAGPNAINYTTAAPASNPGPNGISFNSPSGGGTGTINGGVSAKSGAAANGSVSNAQVSFGNGGTQSGPSVNPKKTGPAYDFEQFQGKYRPSSGGKMNAAEEYMTKNRWDEINDDWARAQEAKKAGNQAEYDSIIGRYGGATSRRGFQDHMLGNMQKNGPGVMDYVWGYKMPQTVVGAGLIFGLGSEIVGANNGQKSNAELYSAPM